MIALAAAVAFLLFSVFGWILFLHRIHSRQPGLPYEPRRAVPWTGWDLLILIGVIIAAQEIAGVTVRSALGVNRESLETTDGLLALIVASTIANLSALLIAAGYLRIRGTVAWRDLGFDDTKLVEDVRLGIIAFYMVAVPVYMLQALLTMWYPPEHPLVTVLQERASSLTWLLCSVSAVVAAPVFEELVFRVLLQGWLEKLEVRLKSRRVIELPRQQTEEQRSDCDTLGGPALSDTIGNRSPQLELSAGTPAGAILDGVHAGWLPIVASSALFALMHLGHGPAPIPLFFLAVALGYIYQRTHRVLPCIIVHALLNGTSLAMVAVGME